MWIPLQWVATLVGMYTIKRRSNPSPSILIGNLTRSIWSLVTQTIPCAHAPIAVGSCRMHGRLISCLRHESVQLMHDGPAPQFYRFQPLARLDRLPRLLL